jgi:hypothetical protein
MAITYKVLGQSNPTVGGAAPGTAVDLYTVPASTNTIISTINICNQANTSNNFSISVIPGGATLNGSHYIAYNTVIPSYDSIALTMGITLASTDKITVSSPSISLSFSVFGSEIT